jgi:hypothetical protein
LYYIGIDTGWSGAIAIYNGDRYFVWDCPYIKTKDTVDKVDLMIAQINMLPLNKNFTAMIEAPFAVAMRDSGSTMISYGVNYGAWIFALRIKDISIKTIHPKIWQTALLRGIPGKNIKDKSRFSALQIAPYLEKQLIKSKHGRADAINIAHYLATQNMR